MSDEIVINAIIFVEKRARRHEKMQQIWQPLFSGNRIIGKNFADIIR